MKSLAVRLTLVALFVIATGASAYLFWMGESRARAEAQAARTFDLQAMAATRTVLDLRAAQQAYVAAGQGDQFWADKVTATLGAIKNSLGALRAEASAPQSVSEIESALASVQDFEQMDRRARDYARANQKLLASDLIFADGIETTAGAITALDRARDVELQARNDAALGIRRRQLYALGAAAAAALLAILLLTPRVSEPESRIVLQEPVRAAHHNDGLELGAALDEGWAPPRKVAPAPPAQPVAAAETPALDLAGVASLCTELARVVDTRSLPAMLERAAGVLDASGIVLWISDPDAQRVEPDHHARLLVAHRVAARHAPARCGKRDCGRVSHIAGADGEDRCGLERRDCGAAGHAGRMRRRDGRGSAPRGRKGRREAGGRRDRRGAARNARGAPVLPRARKGRSGRRLEPARLAYDRNVRRLRGSSNFPFNVMVFLSRTTPSVNSSPFSSR